MLLLARQPQGRRARRRGCRCSGVHRLQLRQSGKGSRDEQPWQDNIGSGRHRPSKQCCNHRSRVPPVRTSCDRLPEQGSQLPAPLLPPPPSLGCCGLPFALWCSPDSTSCDDANKVGTEERLAQHHACLGLNAMQLCK